MRPMGQNKNINGKPSDTWIANLQQDICEVKIGSSKNYNKKPRNPIVKTQILHKIQFEVDLAIQLNSKI